jgi:hypothetical protein
VASIQAIGIVAVFLLALYFGWVWLSNNAASMLPSAAWTVAAVSAGVVTTPTCLLVGVLCDYSLAGPNTTVASIANKLRGRSTVDVAVVSRELSVETKRAKSFFDSLTALNEGRYSSGQDHMRLHSLGVSFQVGSSLPNKGVIGAELVAVSSRSCCTELTAALRHRLPGRRRDRGDDLDQRERLLLAVGGVWAARRPSRAPTVHAAHHRVL